MRRTRRCPTNQQRNLKLLPRHLLRHRHHLIQRRRNQPAQANHIHPMRLRLGQNLFAGHHHPKIDHLIPVARQHDPYNIFSNVVHVPFHRRHENFACPLALIPSRLLLLFHKGSQIGHRFFHHSCAFHYLRQKHFALSKKIPNVPHPPHQRSLNHFQWATILLPRLLRILINKIGHPLQQRMQQPLIHRPLSPYLILNNRFSSRLHRLRIL